MVTAVNNCADDLARQVKRTREKRSHRRDAPVQPAADSAAIQL
jgi:ribosome-associated translation inhibitor RaiA